MQYLKRIIILEVRYNNNLASHQFKEKYGTLEMIRYANSNYKVNFKDKKLNIGYYFFFNIKIVTQYSKWQQIILISILETEYIAMSQNIKEKV